MAAMEGGGGSTVMEGGGGSTVMEDGDAVRAAHEAFVRGHLGSSTLDVVLAFYVVYPASILATLITRGRAGRLWFVMEGCVLIVPMVLSLTVLSSHTLQLSVGLGIVAGLALALAVHYKLKFEKDNYSQKKHLGCVTSMRAQLCLGTAVCILAVDFHSFPRRFAKTEEFGYSLMDLGAAGFVIINGLVEGRRRASYRWVVRDAVVLGVLGVVRLVLVRASNYQHHLTEYGVHANFFFTLALLKVVCSWWVWRLGWVGCSVLGLLVCIGHQCGLTLGGLQAWVLGDAPRDTLLAANREFVVSAPGYITLYLAGAALGSLMYRCEERGRGLCLSLVTVSVVSCAGMWVLHHTLQPPSRRLCNATFVVFSIFYAVQNLTHYAIFEKHLLRRVLPEMPPTPRLFLAINSQSLLFFLLANVCTGLVNKCLNTLDVAWPWDLTIIMLYTSSIAAVVYFLFITDTTRKAKQV